METPSVTLLLARASLKAWFKFFFLVILVLSLGGSLYYVLAYSDKISSQKSLPASLAIEQSINLLNTSIEQVEQSHQSAKLSQQKKRLEQIQSGLIQLQTLGLSSYLRSLDHLRLKTLQTAANLQQLIDSKLQLIQFNEQSAQTTAQTQKQINALIAQLDNQIAPTASSSFLALRAHNPPPKKAQTSLLKEHPTSESLPLLYQLRSQLNQIKQSFKNLSSFSKQANMAKNQAKIQTLSNNISQNSALLPTNLQKNWDKVKINLLSSNLLQPTYLQQIDAWRKLQGQLRQADKNLNTVLTELLQGQNKLIAQLTQTTNHWLLPIIATMVLLVFALLLSFGLGYDCLWRWILTEFSEISAQPQKPASSSANYLKQQIAILSQQHQSLEKAKQEQAKKEKIWTESEQKLKMQLVKSSEEHQHHRQQMAWFQKSYKWSLDHLQKPIRSRLFEQMKLGYEQKASLTNEPKEQALFISTDNLLAKIDNCIVLQQLAAGHARQINSSFQPRVLLEQTYEYLQQRCLDKAISVIPLIDADVPEKLLGDVAKMRLIINNLGRNALDHAKEGQVLLRLKHSNANHYRFEVQDTGDGLSEKQCQYLLTNADKETNNDSSATGLLVCQRLVSLLQGKMGVDSKKDQGSSFWFEIPLVEPAKPVSNLQKNSTEIS